MPISSNIDDPSADFRSAIQAFGLESPSRKGKSVGDRAAKTIAEAIFERGERREGPDGRWQDNAPSTVARKGRNDPNHDTNAMMSIGQIEGEISVSHDEATMTYGKDDECRAKAHWAHEGAGRTKVQRPFYAITDDDADEVLDGLADDILAFLMKG